MRTSGACAHPAARQGERSYYPALEGLFRRGRSHAQAQGVLRSGTGGSGGRPSRLCPLHGTAGAEGRPRPGQVPERGVVEVKGVGDDAWVTAESDQVSRYWDRYRLVLVTNLRDFVLVGTDGTGSPAKLETLRLAEDADDFWSKVEKPRAFSQEVGACPRRIPCPGALAPGRLGRAEGLGVAVGFLRPRRLGPRRGGGRGSFACRRPVGPGGGARNSVRGRARGSVLPFHSDPDVVLRRLLRMGTVVPRRAEEERSAVRGPPQRAAVQVARGILAPAGTGAPSAVPAVVRPGRAAVFWPCRGVGLDIGGTRPCRPSRVFLAIQRR